MTYRVMRAEESRLARERGSVETGGVGVCARDAPSRLVQPVEVGVVLPLSGPGKSNFAP
jgi:hypothetical protein